MIEWLAQQRTEAFMAGRDGDDRMFGFASNDVMAGGNGDDTMSGGSGLDRMFGNDGDDKINGDSGNDVIVGGRSADSLFGSSGDDRISHGEDEGTSASDGSRGLHHCGSGNDVAFINPNNGDTADSDCERVVTDNDS